MNVHADGEKIKTVFFIALINMPMPYSPAVMSRMSAGTLVSSHICRVEARESEEKTLGLTSRVITPQNDYAHGNAEKRSK